MVGKRITAAIASVVLAAALCPSAALADELVAADPGQSASGAASAGSGKETVYVIVGEKKIAGRSWNGEKVKYSYDSRGLLKSEARDAGVNGKMNRRYTYDKKGNLKGYKGTSTNSMDGKVTGTITTDSEGKVKKASLRSVPNSSVTVEMKFSTRISYKSGKAARRTVKVTSPVAKWSVNTKDRFAYNKKGLMKSAKSNTTDTSPQAVSSGTSKTTDVRKFGYDKRGNLASKFQKLSFGYSYSFKYKNSYDKSGNLVKQVEKQGRGIVPVTRSFTYKALEVPKSAAKKVARQQWALLNGNLNFALGPEI